MTSQAFWTLVGVEFLRPRRTFARGWLFLLAIVILVIAIGSDTHAALALISVGGAFATQIPANSLHDRLTGSLEVVTTLPVSAGTLAAARLAAVVLMAALGAVPMAVAGGIAGPAMLEGSSLIHIVMVFFVAAWILFSLLSAVLLAVLLRFKATWIASYGLIVGFVTLVSVLYLYDRFFGSPLRLIQAVMTSDHTLAIAIGSAVVGSTVVLTASFLLTRRGFEIYQPEPDAMDW